LAAQLHRRASRWFANYGLYAEAIDHAIQARDFTQAGELIEQQAEALTKRGEYHTLATWIEQLPPASKTQWPRLGIVYALHKVLQHDLAGAEAALHTIAPALHMTHPALLGEYQTVQATIASKGNQFEKADTLARQAWELLPATSAFLRGRLMVIMGIGAYYRDDHERALLSFAEAGRLALSAGDLNTALNALANEALVLCLRGELRRAAVAFRHILKLAADHGAEQLSNISMVHGHLADLLFELNDLAGMGHHLELTRASLVYGHMPALELEYQIYLAKLYQAEGNRSAAIVAIQQAFAIADAHQMPASNRGEVTACQVRLWLAYGNLDDAIAWADSSGLSADDEITALREPEYVALARVLIARGEASQALLLLARLHKAADLVGRRWVQIELLALQAVAHAVRGNRRSAHHTVKQALQLGVSEGYIRSFVLAGETFQALLLEAQLQIDEPHLRQYANLVLAAFPPANAALADAQAPRPGNQVNLDLLEPLTEREIEVLRLVAAGYSDREIADQLVVVVGTAKRHLNNIYGKLLVHSRTQALVRARALGLLE
jgi:LuxR family maltose regulon positive regulatory protein